jgi:hypothetical protein
MSADLFPSFNLFEPTGNSNLQGPATFSNPDEAVLYFEKNFTSIFNNLLFAADNSASSTSSGFGDDDFFSSSSSDPFFSNTNFYSSQIDLLRNDYMNSTNVGDLNEYAALIGKDATYILEGVIKHGTIESVVIESGVSYLRINDENVDVKNISEISA